MVDLDYRRLIIGLVVLWLLFTLTPLDQPLVLAADAVVAFLASGWAWKWLKKKVLRPVLLFDLYGVLIAGDYQVQDVYENPGTRSLIRGLRKRYFVAALTNLSPEMFRLWDAKHHLSREFDAFYYSGKYGVRKPEPQIFKIVMRDLGVRGRDIVFIDDNAENINAAKKLGIRGIVFENAAQCEKALNAMGIRAR